MQLAVRYFQVDTRIIALPDDCRLIGLVGKMAIDAVVARVEFAVFEPANMQVLLRVGDVLDFGKRLTPVHDPGLFGPESFVVLHGTAIHVEILLFVQQTVFAEPVIYWIDVCHRVSPIQKARPVPEPGPLAYSGIERRCRH